MRHEAAPTLKCYAGGQAYCLDAAQVLAIERSDSIIPSAEAGGSIGWIPRRNRRVPVYGLVERLGRHPVTDRVGAVLVFNSVNPWGLAVERVSRFQHPPGPPQTIPPAIASERAAWFRGVVVEDGDLVLFLSPDRLHPDAAALPMAPPKPPAPQRLAKLPAPPQTGARRLLLFPPNNPVPPGLLPDKRSRLLFGLSYTQVLELISWIEPVPVPSASPHILGLIPWRGRPVTLVDAGALLGLPPATLHPGARLVIVHSPLWQAPVAIPAGSDIHARKLPLRHGPCEVAMDLRYARGAFKIDGGLVILVPDVDAIAGPLMNGIGDRHLQSPANEAD
jgi:purine-binding chemotaxis protein CheW